MDEIKIFCNNVEKLMTENGLTKKEMAEIMQVSKNAVTSILNGKLTKSVGVNALINLCLYFRKAPSYFFS